MRPPPHLLHGRALKSSNTAQRRRAACPSRGVKDILVADDNTLVLKNAAAMVDWTDECRTDTELLTEFALRCRQSRLAGFHAAARCGPEMNVAIGLREREPDQQDLVQWIEQEYPACRSLFHVRFAR